MSDGLQCPVCDEEIPYEDESGTRSLSQLLGAGVSSAVADHTEEQLRKHLETHSIEDFVTALVMCDRYIEQVEAERDELSAWKQGVLTKMQQGPIITANRPQDIGPPPPIAAPPGYETQFVEPQSRAPRRQQVDPDRTLIPHIPVGQRPEGAVGRRT